MPDEPQVSGAAVTVADKPAADSGAQKGSDGAASVQEHRDTAPTSPSAAEVWQKLSPQEQARIVAQLDPDSLYRHNPGLKQHLHSTAQSLADRRANEMRARIETEALARMERERLKAADPDTLAQMAENWQQRIKQEDDLAPLLQQAREEGRQAGWNEAFQKGMDAGMMEVRTAVDKFRTRHGITADEWRQMVDSVQDTAEAFDRALEEATTRKQKKELTGQREQWRQEVLAELEARQTNESTAERRATESTPDTSGGSPAGSDVDFLREFAEGRNGDFAHARRLLGI